MVCVLLLRTSFGSPPAHCQGPTAPLPPHNNSLTDLRFFLSPFFLFCFAFVDSSITAFFSFLFFSHPCRRQQKHLDRNTTQHTARSPRFNSPRLASPCQIIIITYNIQPLVLLARPSVRSLVGSGISQNQAESKKGMINPHPKIKLKREEE